MGFSCFFMDFIEVGNVIIFCVLLLGIICNYKTCYKMEDKKPSEFESELIFLALISKFNNKSFNISELQREYSD